MPNMLIFTGILAIGFMVLGIACFSVLKINRLTSVGLNDRSGNDMEISNEISNFILDEMAKIESAMKFRTFDLPHPSEYLGGSGGRDYDRVMRHLKRILRDSRPKFKYNLSTMRNRKFIMESGSHNEGEFHFRITDTSIDNGETIGMTVSPTEFRVLAEAFAKAVEYTKVL